MTLLIYFVGFIIKMNSSIVVLVYLNGRIFQSDDDIRFEGYFGFINYYFIRNRKLLAFSYLEAAFNQNLSTSCYRARSQVFKSIEVKLHLLTNI